MKQNGLLLQETKRFYPGRDFSCLVSGFCRAAFFSRLRPLADAEDSRRPSARGKNPGTQGNALLVGTLIISIGEVSLSIAISSSHVGKRLCEKRITWVASTYRRKKYEPLLWSVGDRPK